MEEKKLPALSDKKPIEKNVPFMGSTKDWQPGTTTVTGQYPNRAARRKAAKKKK